MKVMGRDYYSKLKSPPYEPSALTIAVNHLMKVPLSDPCYSLYMSLSASQRAACLSLLTETGEQYARRCRPRD